VEEATWISVTNGWHCSEAGWLYMHC